MNTDVTTCRYHPDRAAGVRCQRCDAPICPACMHQASVGFHCPACVQGNKQRVVRPQQRWAAAGSSGRPLVTSVLIAVNAVVFVLSIAGGSGGGISDSWVQRFSLWGPGVDVNHEYYRIVTGGFLHANIIHIVMNMLALWFTGSRLEPALGRARFALVYGLALLAGSAGALLASPTAPTVGASGAIFGLFGAEFVVQRARGLNPWQTGLATVIIINLVFTFSIAGISWGGHVGGLVGGMAAGWVLEEAPRRFRANARTMVPLLLAGLAVLSLVLAVYGASRWPTTR